MARSNVNENARTSGDRQSPTATAEYFLLLWSLRRFAPLTYFLFSSTGVTTCDKHRLRRLITVASHDDSIEH